MRKQVLSLCIAILFGAMCTVLFSPITPLHAQGVTSGAISGSVKFSGGSLSGINIIAIHEPTGTQYKTGTKSNGEFLISNVRVGGPYTVKASAVSANGSVANQTVKLGQNLRIVIALNEKVTQANAITVIADKNNVDVSKTGAQTNIGKEQLNNFPTISRSFQDFAKFTPQVLQCFHLLLLHYQYLGLMLHQLRQLKLLPW